MILAPSTAGIGETGAQLRSAEHSGSQGDRTLNGSWTLQSPRATQKAGCKVLVSFITTCFFLLRRQSRCYHVISTCITPLEARVPLWRRVGAELRARMGSSQQDTIAPSWSPSTWLPLSSGDHQLALS